MCVSCTGVVLTCFVISDVCMCGFCNVRLCVCVGFVMCEFFGNICTYTYCVFLLFLLRIFILFCVFV